MAEGDLKWRYDAGSEIYSGIVVGSDGVIYFGTDWPSKIIALNPDGSLKWEYGTRNSIWGGLALSNDESVVYCGDRSSGLGCDLYAIYTATGNLKWEYNDITRSEIFSDITVDSSDNIYFGEKTGYLISLDYDGNLNWEHNIGETHCGQKLKGSVIYVIGFGGLFELNISDGSENWNFDGVKGSQATMPSLASDGTIYYGSWWDFYAINSDGSLKWNYTATAAKPNAIGSNNNIWFLGDAPPNLKLFVLDPDGNLVWSYPIPDWIGNGVGPTGLALDLNDIAYVGCWDNKLYVINQDGTFRWSYTTGNNVKSGIAFSPSEDTVYFGSLDNYLYAVEKLGPPDDVDDVVITYRSASPIDALWI